MKQSRGFAVMDEDKVRSIASKGGKSAHAKGVAHQWSVEEARIAGSKGGKAPRKPRIKKEVSEPVPLVEETQPGVE